jgi:hypothetical protein
MAIKLRERPAVSKQTMYRFGVERFVLRKVNKLEGKEQYCLVTTLGNLHPEWTSVELEKLLERISEFQPETIG